MNEPANASLLDAFRLFAVPLWPLELRRPMKTFRSALGLEVAHAGVPSADLLAAVVYSQRSLQAVLRKMFGETDFKNARNFSTGKSQNSRSAARIAKEHNLSVETLRALFAPGPESPFATLLLGAEGALYRIGSAPLGTPVPCPCCGGNLLEPASSWWGSQPGLSLGPGAYQLIDRVLFDLIALNWLRTPGVLEHLAQPSRHPYWQWLRLVQRLAGGEHVGDLPARLGSDRVNSPRVWAIGRGEAMTADAVEALVSGLDGSEILRRDAITARGLSLAAEVLVATAAVELDGVIARGVLQSRVRILTRDLMIASLHQQGKLRMRPQEGPMAHH